MGFMQYDSNNVRDLVVRYFIKSKLPLKHVESNRFKELMNGIELRFKVPCQITFKKKLHKIIRGTKA
jgi:hypothetical protein